MIKIYGLNYKEGSGDYYIFGHFNGNGEGKGIDYYFSYSHYGKGFGDEYNFGGGNGGSYTSFYFKKEFQKK